MKQKTNNFLQRFKSNFFKKSTFLPATKYALLIWVLLSGMFLMVPPHQGISPYLIVLDCALHTFLITFSLYFSQVVYFSLPYCENRKKIPVQIILVVFIYGSVIFGELAAQYISQQCFYHGQFPKEVLWESLIFSLFVSTIFVGVYYSYRILYDKLEKAMLIIKEKEVNEQILKNLKSQAELEALQAKINPHFLFNTLNSIASLINEDPSKAELAVEKLSRIFRFTLKNSTSGKVTLEESLKYVRSYLELEKLRLGERLQFDIEVIGDIQNVFVQDLLIQPLVENSIKHGISPKVEGGRIKIKVEITAEEMLIEVSDDGVGYTEKTSDSGHGLVNIRERLALAYKNNYSMEFFSENGVTVKLKIPRGTHA